MLLSSEESSGVATLSPSRSSKRRVYLTRQAYPNPSPRILQGFFSMYLGTHRATWVLRGTVRIGDEVAFQISKKIWNWAVSEVIGQPPGRGPRQIVTFKHTLHKSMGPRSPVSQHIPPIGNNNPELILNSLISPPNPRVQRDSHQRSLSHSLLQGPRFPTFLSPTGILKPSIILPRVLQLPSVHSPLTRRPS